MYVYWKVIVPLNWINTGFLFFLLLLFVCVCVLFSFVWFEIFLIITLDIDLLQNLCFKLKWKAWSHVLLVNYFKIPSVKYLCVLISCYQTSFFICFSKMSEIWNFDILFYECDYVSYAYVNVETGKVPVWRTLWVLVKWRNSMKEMMLWKDNEHEINQQWHLNNSRCLKGIDLIHNLRT